MFVCIFWCWVFTVLFVLGYCGFFGLVFFGWLGFGFCSCSFFVVGFCGFGFFCVVVGFLCVVVCVLWVFLWRVCCGFLVFCLFFLWWLVSGSDHSFFVCILVFGWFFAGVFAALFNVLVWLFCGSCCVCGLFCFQAKSSSAMWFCRGLCG